MSHGTDRPLAFVNTVTSYFKKSRTFLDQLSDHQLPERHSDPCASVINPLNVELNPICHLLALLGAHHIFHVSRIRVNIFCVLVADGPMGSRTNIGISYWCEPAKCLCISA